MRLPDDSVNVSKRTPLIDAVLLIGGMLALVAVAGIAAAFLVNLAVPYISVESEVAHLSRVATALKPDDVPSEETKRLTALLERVGGGWSDDPYQHSLVVLDQPENNAFALPGGGIYVTRGLLNACSSENELAFVLGHELGHFAARDHLRGLGRNVVLSLLLAPLLGQDASDAASWVTTFVINAHSRDQERAADAFGLNLVQRLYGHVNGANAFFLRMLSQDLMPGGFLQTHPLSQQRIENLAELARQRGWSHKGTLTPLAP